MTSECISSSTNKGPKPSTHRLGFVFSYVLLAFAALSLCPLQAAASQEGYRETDYLLTRSQGLAIVDAISDHHQSLRGKRGRPDCSHLVNDIYDLAGFPYAYAKSADLYRGHASFLRVNAPQPGDLIVWRGHVGLVLDPRQHFFYSSLRSGLETEDYTSAYWRRRGAPRFYRYRAASDQTILTARHIAPRNDLEGNFRTQLVSQSTRDDPGRNVASRDTLESLSSGDDDSPDQHIPDAEELGHIASSKVLANIRNKKPRGNDVVRGKQMAATPRRGMSPPVDRSNRLDVLRSK